MNEYLDLPWPLFTEEELAALLLLDAPGAAPDKALGRAEDIVAHLEETGWIMEIRNRKYRATRKLVVRCLEVGLSTHRKPPSTT